MLVEILALIREGFAYMEGRIDPPSSMHSLTLEALQDHRRIGEIWSLGPPLSACVFLTPKPDALYIGKLCVAAQARGRGLARHLIGLAENRARTLRLPGLELQTRVELTGNQATFAALGFTETARTAHPGYDRPTSITLRRPVG